MVRRRCAFEGAFSLIVKEMCHRGWDVGEGVELEEISFCMEEVVGRVLWSLFNVVLHTNVPNRLLWPEVDELICFYS